ncbi:cell division protein FtsA [Clostridium thermarum]|uniref:cell division protein FtsA n=1 Tax=Clostridium thermarum TaxID=1716543 RepID=UPI001124AA55|nr:cell division protein FtsA [Clostridium thermarum]
MGTKVSPNEIIFSLDIGTRSVIGTVGMLKGRKLHVVHEYYIEHQERAMIDGQIHDISLVAAAVNTVKKQLEKKLKFKLERVAIAAAGRFLRTTMAKAELKLDDTKEIDREIIRSLELTAVKNAEDEVNRETQGKLYCVGYSVKSYYLNGFVINNLLSHKGENAGAEIIATFLPRSVVDSLYAVMERVGLEVSSLTLEPIAAIEAAIPQNLRLLNLALIDIGAGTSDIAISSKDSIVAYGMVPLAGDEVTEAIAQYYLVDFNTAERIKREASEKEIMHYTDILGLENQITREELFRVIAPTVKKICDEIGSKIVELNGGKAPSAVFLVGGGAHTPLLVQFLAEKLNIPTQRVAIKGRENIEDCVVPKNDLGSVGVTVLGIALVCIKRMGQDFIDVTLNGNVISLFNYNKHTVMDVIIQGGINPKVLLGRNGKNIRFIVNGAKRLAFGTLAESAVIRVNGAVASVDSPVKEGDIIEIKYAKDGKDAAPKVLEQVAAYDAVSFYFNDKLYNFEPIAMINGERVDFQHVISENDNVEIIYPKTLHDFIKYVLISVSPDSKFYIGEQIISYDYIIKEGDRIIEKDISTTTVINAEKDTAVEDADNTKEAQPQVKNEVAIDEMKFEEKTAPKEVTVKVNSQTVILKGKDKYIFIDIFNYIQFDRTRTKGLLILKLNGKQAGYYDELKDGDVIEITWA